MNLYNYLIHESVNCNFNVYECAFFQGILATLEIPEPAESRYTTADGEKFVLYQIITTPEKADKISAICKANDIDARPAAAKIEA